MLKAFGIVVFCFGSVFGTCAQELANLNGFKYAMVETLFYKDDKVDIHGISVMTRQNLTALGLKVIAQNKESWPEQVLAEECLVLDFRITAKDRVVGRQKVIIEGYDCNQRRVITLTGFGNAESYTESYRLALNNAFEDILEGGYSFDPGLKIFREVETIALSRGDATDYLDNGVLDPIEGIYQTSQDEGVSEIFIRKGEEDQFKAVVLESSGEVWVVGDVKGYFEKSSIPNVYEVRWSNKRKEEQETIAFTGEGGNLSIEVTNTDESKTKIDYRKSYPN